MDCLIDIVRRHQAAGIAEKIILSSLLSSRQPLDGRYDLTASIGVLLGQKNTNTVNLRPLNMVEISENLSLF